MNKMRLLNWLKTKLISNKQINQTMKNLIIALFIAILVQPCVAQKAWKKYLIAGSSVLVSGMMDGTIESINYHYENGFKARFPKANDQFWNPAVSWKNKYRNGDPALGRKFMGSTTALVFTTDAYHMLRTGKRAIDASTLVYAINKDCSIKKKKARRKTMVKDFIVLTAIRCVGFHVTYTYLFKPVNK